MVVMMAPAPPNDTGDNQTTSDETPGNEKVMTNYRRRLLWRAVLYAAKPVTHAPCQVKNRSSLPTGSVLLHHPKT